MMEKHTNNKQHDLIALKILHLKSQTKKTLWETEIISYEEAAYLLDISKDTLRERGNQFKQIRQGNKIYYSTKQLRDALTTTEKYHMVSGNNTDKIFNSYL